MGKVVGTVRLPELIQLEKELEEIIEVICGRIHDLMPKLKESHSDSELWPFLLISGKYFAYYGAAIENGETADNSHSFALGRILQEEDTQNMIAKLVAGKVDKMAGV